MQVDADAVARALADLLRAATRHGGVEPAVAVDGPRVKISPGRRGRRPIVLGEDAKDLGAVVAVLVVRGPRRRRGLRSRRALGAPACVARAVLSPDVSAGRSPGTVPGLGPPPGARLAEQPREPAVLEHPPAGLAAAGSSRPCAPRSPRARSGCRTAGTARPGGCGSRRRRRRPCPARGARGRASRSSWIAACSPAISSSSSCDESAKGDRRERSRISFAWARPMPAISRWSRRSGCRRRDSPLQDACSSGTSISSASARDAPSSASSASGGAARRRRASSCRPP